MRGCVGRVMPLIRANRGVCVSLCVACVLVVACGGLCMRSMKGEIGAFVAGVALSDFGCKSTLQPRGYIQRLGATRLRATRKLSMYDYTGMASRETTGWDDSGWGRLLNSVHETTARVRTCLLNLQTARFI